MYAGNCVIWYFKKKRKENYNQLIGMVHYESETISIPIRYQLTSSSKMKKNKKKKTISCFQFDRTLKCLFCNWNEVQWPNNRFLALNNIYNSVRRWITKGMPE